MTCNACGSTSAPEGSRFCPECAANLAMESEDVHTMDTPTATALPMSTVMPSSNATPSTIVTSAVSYDNHDTVNSALYFKNPSPEIMGRAKSFGFNLGVLFIATCNPRGKFTVPKSIVVVSVLSVCKINLSIADFVHPVTTILVIPSVLSGLLITVPRGVRVETQGIGIIGVIWGLSTQNIHVGQEGPLLIVKGLTVMGGVKVSVNKKVPPVTVVEYS
jgi:hypothetical protein